VTLFCEEDVLRFEVPIDYVTVVEVFKSEKNFGCVEFGDFLFEDFLSPK
jgi:predicted RNA-binding protein